MLHKLGLDPFVLANTGGGGLTIIEALETEIGPKSNQARFGIVLMTPDDMGYAKADGSGNIQPRARQNVVLEMGMLISAIGRSNVAILKKGRNTRSALPKMKDIGDKSAHSRRFVAHRSDIDKIIGDLRVIAQEFIYLAGLK